MSPSPHKDTMLELLASGAYVRVTFDPRHANVNVPPQFRASAELVLEYGYDMPVPIPDLHVGEVGIAATLSFNRQPVPTFVPWVAVTAVVASPLSPKPAPQPAYVCVLCGRGNQEVHKMIRGDAGCVCSDCAVQAIATLATPEEPLSYWLSRLTEETLAMQSDAEGDAP